jgi:hypothetical protein
MTLRHLAILIAALAALAAVPGALAQTPIDPSHRFSWQENCGWMNWIAGPGALPPGSPDAVPSVFIARTYISGWIWSENIGWINLGHAPLDGMHHANVDSTDYGVNRDPATGVLTGFAWSENTGWINFAGGSLASPPNPARLDTVASRFRGFAWGENIGWMNLDDATAYVGVLCPADFNQDTHTTIDDIFAFLDAWFAHDPRADVNMDGLSNVQDIFDFLTTWFAGC